MNFWMPNVYDDMISAIMRFIPHFKTNSDEVERNGCFGLFFCVKLLKFEWFTSILCNIIYHWVSSLVETVIVWKSAHTNLPMFH